MARPQRPLKARVRRVPSGARPSSPAAQTGWMPASGQRSRAVPICTALAPSTSAAATPRASPMPPVATTGTRTASTTCGSSASRPTACSRATAASKAPRWPPASAPWATMTSAPAASAARASATLVTVANQAMPAALSWATKPGGYRPMIEDTAAGCSASRAWHWASKFGSDASPASALTAGPKRPRKSRSRASCSASRGGAGSGTQRLICSGPWVVAR